MGGEKGDAMEKMMSPSEAAGFDDVCRLESDNFSSGKYWILHDRAGVTITEQTKGAELASQVTVPIKEFRDLVCWFTTQQKTKQ